MALFPISRFLYKHKDQKSESEGGLNFDLPENINCGRGGMLGRLEKDKGNTLGFNEKKSFFLKKNYPRVPDRQTFEP